MSQLYSQLPILSIITYLPLVGALVLLLISKENKNLIMKAATAIAAVDLVLSLPLWWLYDRGSEGFQFVEHASWIPSIGVSYKVGIDGISLLLLLLTTLLGFIAILSSWTAITDRVKEYYIYMLLLQTGMMGVFISLDFFLFYVFWEVMLVPMYFLIGIWGGPRKLYAAIKFFLYTLFGSVLMLLGILAVYFQYGKVTGTYTFDIEALHHMGAWTSPEWIALQGWVFLAFFIGFAIKVPMFPFHTWLPDAHVEAPTAGSVILAAVLLKMGTYGFLRFSLPMMPEATLHYMPWLLSLCVIGIIYGAMVAMVQKDWKKLVAYSSVSHLGFCMIGIFALNWQGLNGGILQMINHGLSTGGLFLIVGLIYERRHTRLLSEFGGLSKVMPKFAVYFMLITLSSIGLPLLNGFIGEFAVLSGIFQVRDRAFSFFGYSPKWWAVLTASGIVLGAAYMLWLYQRTMFGRLDKPENQTLKDLNFREVWTLIPLVALCFWIGLYPAPVFDVIARPVGKLVRQIGKTYYSGEPAAALGGAPGGGTAGRQVPATEVGRVLPGGGTVGHVVPGNGAVDRGLLVNDAAGRVLQGIGAVGSAVPGSSTVGHIVPGNGRVARADVAPCAPLSISAGKPAVPVCRLGRKRESGRTPSLSRVSREGGPRVLSTGVLGPSSDTRLRTTAGRREACRIASLLDQGGCRDRGPEDFTLDDVVSRSDSGGIAR